MPRYRNSLPITRHKSCLLSEHLVAAMVEAAMSNVAPFLRIPAEIRLAIYKLLLTDHQDKTLRIRTETPSVYEKRKKEQRERRRFRFIADRMRSWSTESTYCLQKSPFQELHTAILGVNHQTHTEASHVLYSEHSFDFDMDIESILPFLQDLTPESLSSIKRIKMVKRSLPYTKDFDRCEWRNACAFIAEKTRWKEMQLKQLDLNICGGTPSLANRPALHWKQRHTYTKSDFSTISKLDEMEEDMEWVRHIVAIQGLQVLNVQALLEHCPIPGSKKMAFFVSFSASIEAGFAEYLRSLMSVQAS